MANYSPVLAAVAPMEGGSEGAAGTTAAGWSGTDLSAPSTTKWASSCCSDHILGISVLIWAVASGQNPVFRCLLGAKDPEGPALRLSIWMAAGGCMWNVVRSFGVMSF